MKYTVKVSALGDEYGGGFQALVPRFGRGVVGYGETQTAAVEDLLAVLPHFVEALKATGQDVPEPEQSRDVEEFSGKFNVRLPKLLHAELVDLAEENEVSLNQLVTMLLTSAMERARAGRLSDEREVRAEVSPGADRWVISDEGAMVFDMTSMTVKERTEDVWSYEAIRN